jgi:hypothetical protein
MGLLRSARIQWEHSAGAAGLFGMWRAEGAESSRMFSAEGLLTGFV